MVLRPWRENQIWEFIRNSSGIILNIFQIHPNPCFNRIMSCLNIFQTIKSKFEKIQKSSFVSHHPPTNPDQRPLLKCGLGHKSMKDINIINNDYLKSGVVQKQNLKSDISGILRHPHFQKVCISLFWETFSKMAPQAKPLCSWDAQRNSE